MLIPIVVGEPTIHDSKPYIIIGLAVGGGLLLFYEFYRRSKTLALVNAPGGIAIYRKGKLDLITLPEGTQRFVLSWFNTFRFLIGPVFLTVTFVAGYLQPKSHIVFLAGAGICAFSLASVVYTRILCVHYFIPKANGRAEQIVLSRSNLRGHEDLCQKLGYS